MVKNSTNNCGYITTFGKQSMVSLSLAQNYLGQASVNPTVLCKTKLSEHEFLEIIKASIRVDGPNRIMFIE
jgi:hypothetical protein